MANPRGHSLVPATVPPPPPAAPTTAAVPDKPPRSQAAFSSGEGSGGGEGGGGTWGGRVDERKQRTRLEAPVTEEAGGPGRPGPPTPTRNPKQAVTQAMQDRWHRSPSSSPAPPPPPPQLHPMPHRHPGLETPLSRDTDHPATAAGISLALPQAFALPQQRDYHASRTITLAQPPQLIALGHPCDLKAQIRQQAGVCVCLHMCVCVLVCVPACAHARAHVCVHACVCYITFTFFICQHVIKCPHPNPYRTRTHTRTQAKAQQHSRRPAFSTLAYARARIPRQPRPTHQSPHLSHPRRAPFPALSRPVPSFETPLSRQRIRSKETPQLRWGMQTLVSRGGMHTPRLRRETMMRRRTKMPLFRWSKDAPPQRGRKATPLSRGGKETPPSRGSKEAPLSRGSMATPRSRRRVTRRDMCVAHTHSCAWECVHVCACRHLRMHTRTCMHMYSFLHTYLHAYMHKS